MLAAGQILNFYILTMRPVPIQSFFFYSFFFSEWHIANVFFQNFFFFTSREGYFEIERKKGDDSWKKERKSIGNTEIYSYETVHMEMKWVYGFFLNFRVHYKTKHISSSKFSIYAYFSVCLCRFAGCHWDYRFRWKICNSMEKKTNTFKSTHRYHTMVFRTWKRIKHKDIDIEIINMNQRNINEQKKKKNENHRLNTTDTHCA